MKYFVLLSILFFSINAKGQDLDIYKHRKNSNFNLPAIPKGMTYKEFKILSTDLRMQDMMIATILPGHVHFKIGEKRKGFYILGTRGLGYAGWVYLAIEDKSLTNIILLDNIGIDNTISTSDIIIAYGSLGLIIGSYLYDWIHGRYLLDEKQNKIRYKYAKKKLQLGMNIIQSYHKNYPGLALTYKF